VDDAATCLLMQEFYVNLWQKKLPKGEALRQAQLTVLRHSERVRAEAARLKLPLTRDLDPTEAAVPAADKAPAPVRRQSSPGVVGRVHPQRRRPLTGRLNIDHPGHGPRHHEQEATEGTAHTVATAHRAAQWAIPSEMTSGSSSRG
jgi:CHAT domain-containing protein